MMRWYFYTHFSRCATTAEKKGGSHETIKQHIGGDLVSPLWDAGEASYFYAPNTTKGLKGAWRVTPMVMDSSKSDPLKMERSEITCQIKYLKRTRCKMPLELQIFAEPGTGSGDGVRVVQQVEVSSRILRTSPESGRRAAGRPD